MFADLRYALRQIAKFPGYTATVVLTLAVGIAVNIQIFGLLSGQVLLPLAVRDAGRAQVIFERSDLFNLPHGLSFPDFQDIRSDSKTLTDHIASFFFPAHVSSAGQSPARMWIEAVTPDAFDKFGLTTVLGRPLQPADGELPPGVPVAVLTHRTWQNQFGGDKDVIGRTILINTKPYTIVGVLNPGFESFSYSISSGLFVPSGALGQLHPAGDALFKYRGAKAWRVLAHAKPETSLADANAELALFAQRFIKDYPGDHRHTRFQSVWERNSRPDPSFSDFLPVFVTLFSGLVLLVLLIACANAANLMSAHALNREKELVVRAALGASRVRLLRQLLVESVLLALLAGGLGYLLSLWGSGLVDQFKPQGDLPIRTDQSVGLNTVWFTVVISLIAGFVSGLMPALRSSRIDLNENLKQGAGRQIGATRHRLRNSLVIGQVAVSCVVLITAGVFVRSLHATTNLNLGFRSERLLLASTDVGLQGYDESRGLHFQQTLVEEISALPGVESATFTQSIPFGNNIKIANIFPENPSVQLNENQASTGFSGIHTNFLSTMGIPLLRGRDFVASDDARGSKVAVINEAMARAIWPGKDAIGQHFRLYASNAPPIEVIGIVPTGKYVTLTEEPRPFFYIPLAQHYEAPTTLMVRARGNPSALARSVADVIHSHDADLPVYNVMTFEEHLATSLMGLMPLRMGATLASVQGALALVLAILGLYSVVSYGVSRRTREIGVRMALGATSESVLRLVAREGLRLILIGLGIGLLLAIGAVFGLSRLVYGVTAFDPLTLFGVLVLLLATSVFACWLPARRATKIDPMVALRSD